MSTFPRLERRTSVRVTPKGSVVLIGSAGPRRGRLVNLSAGGLLMALDGSPIIAAERVSVEVRLDAAMRDWIRIPGQVSRVAPEGLAVTFDEPNRELEHLLVDISAASRSNERRLSVVLLDATQARRLAIAEAFRGAGCNVLDVATSLEAIVRLGESHFEPDVIAIADSLPAETADELRAFVEREHPNAKLVRIGDDAIEPVGLAHWLSSADPDGDLASRICLLLGQHRRQ